MESDEYQAALRTIVQRLRPNKWTAVSTVLGGRRISRTLARKAAAFADELAVIVPPGDVASEHKAFVDAVRKTSCDLDALASRNDLRAFERFEAMADLDFARAELSALEAKGYRLRD